MKSFNKIIVLSTSVLLLGLGGCKKSYLEKLPTNQAPLADVFKTTTGAEAAIQGLNAYMFSIPSGAHDRFGQKSIDLYNDMMGDDIAIRDQGAGWLVSVYNYTAARGGSSPGSYPWSFYFGMINNANQIIVNIDDATGLQEDRDLIKGKALFYRAYAYYNLTLYYQFAYGAVGDPNSVLGLPLYDQPTREGKPRATLQQTYDFIKNDLKDARQLMDANGYARNDKSEINLDVVNAISARVAFAMEDWNAAITFAQDAMQNYPLMTGFQINNGFNDWNNSEWIWGSNLVEDQTSNVASFIGHMDINAGGYAALGQQKLINRNLYNSMSDSDSRKAWWFPKNQGLHQRFSNNKFRVKVKGTFGTNVSYIRSAEMKLIQIESMFHLKQYGQSAAELLSFVQTRQPDYVVPDYTTNNALLLIEIIRQRRIELWGEGFRYSDIKRLASFQGEGGIIGLGLTDLDLPGLHREGTGASATIAGNAFTIPDPFSNQFVFKIPGSELSSNSAVIQNP